MCGQTIAWKYFEADRVRSDLLGGQYQLLVLSPLDNVVAVVSNCGCTRLRRLGERAGSKRPESGRRG
jgi:hypothetical protein